MHVTETIFNKIAGDTGIDAADLAVAGLLALLREKKSKIMMERLEIFDRYGVDSLNLLEARIKEGNIPEHPAWEDLILVENLEAALANIDEDIDSVQKPA